MKNLTKHLSEIITPSIIIIAAILCFNALSNLETGNDRETKKQLEETIHRAVISCYSIEGSYPPNLDYLLNNYIIHYNKDKYIIKYEFYASNLMPDITVLENRK